VSIGGYADPQYLESLSEFGETVLLPESGAGWLVRGIGGTDLLDARAPYPLLACQDWKALGSELARHSDWVSAVAVPDPLTAPEPKVLRDNFPDACRPYKTHWVVRMDGGYAGPTSEGHRRNVRKGESTAFVSRVEPTSDALCDWLRLYDRLVAKHRFDGIARFSKRAFAQQFAMSGMRIYAAKVGSKTVSMSLWLVDGERAYYHLGATNERGYAARAPYAMFQVALSDLGESGCSLVLLGAGAGIEEDAEDGLSRFKRGWSNESRQSYLCGRILDRTAYERLGGDDGSSYFPAYRNPAALAHCH